MLPPAPGRLSTTIDWCSRSESGCAMRRAVVSTPPPGGQGTISLIGPPPGHDCACAPLIHSSTVMQIHFNVRMSSTPKRNESLHRDGVGGPRLAVQPAIDVQQD